MRNKMYYEKVEYELAQEDHDETGRTGHSTSSRILKFQFESLWAYRLAAMAEACLLVSTPDSFWAAFVRMLHSYISKRPDDHQRKLAMGQIRRWLDCPMYKSLLSRNGFGAPPKSFTESLERQAEDLTPLNPDSNEGEEGADDLYRAPSPFQTPMSTCRYQENSQLDTLTSSTSSEDLYSPRASNSLVGTHFQCQLVLATHHPESRVQQELTMPGQDQDSDPGQEVQSHNTSSHEIQRQPYAADQETHSPSSCDVSLGTTQSLPRRLRHRKVSEYFRKWLGNLCGSEL